MAQDQINIKATLDTTQFDTSLKGMKDEFAALEAQLGSSLLSEEDKQKVLIRMGQLKGGIDDLNNQVNQLGQTNAFGDLVQVTTPLVGLMTAAGAATQLFGVENEKLNKIIQQTTSLTVGLSAIREVADSKAIKSIIIKRTAQAKSLILDKLTFSITKKQAAANIAEATTKTAGVKATNFATKAQLLWNAAMNANPILLVITAIAALAAAIYFLSDRQKDSNKLTEEEIKLKEELVQNQKELEEAYADTKTRLRELEIQYQVLYGVISVAEGDIATLEEERLRRLEELGKVYQENADKFETTNGKTIEDYIALNELIKQTTQSILDGGVDKIFDPNTKTFADVILSEERKEQLEKDLEEINGILSDAKEIVENNAKEQLRINQIYDARTQNIRDKAEKEQIASAEKVFEEKKKYIGSIINEIEKEFTAIRSNLDKIEQNYTSFTKKTEDIKLDLLPDGLDKDLQVIDKEVNTLAESFGSIITNNERLLELNQSSKKLNQDRIDTLNTEISRLGVSVDIYDSIKKDQQVILDDMEARGVSQKFIMDQEIKYLGQNQAYAEKARTAQQEIFDIQKKINLIKKEQVVIEGEIQEGANIQGRLTSEEEYLDLLNKLKAKKVKEATDADKDLQEQKRLDDLQKEKEHQDKLLDIKLASADLAITKIQRLNDSNKDVDLQKAKDDEKELLDDKLELLDEYYKERINLAETTEEKDLLRDQMEEEMDGLEDSFNSRWTSIKQNMVDSFAELGQIIGDTLGEIFARDIARKFDVLNETLQQELDLQYDSLEARRDADLISQGEYEEQKQILDKEAAAKERELMIKKLEAEKKLAMFQIIIDTSIGVAKSWGQGGGVFGAPLAALVAAQGALQLALVASQPIPEYETGGYVMGPDHSEGGVMTNLEGGEFIVNKEVAQTPGMSELLNKINEAPNAISLLNDLQTPEIQSPYMSSLVNGIQTPDMNSLVSQITQSQPSVNNTPIVDNESFLKDLKESIMEVTNIPVVNVETEYTKVQRKVNNIETRARF